MERAGTYHTAVLLKEAVDGLAVQPDGVYLDATFGGGGHSREILSRLGPRGKLIAFDQDPDARQNLPEDERLIFIPENFRHAERFIRAKGLNEIDGALADLGVSSFQIDEKERGFSTRWSGPLDMRMDKKSGKTAQKILETYGEKELQNLFEKYGSLRNSRALARHIVKEREHQTLETTMALRTMVEPLIRGNYHQYLAQVFQSIRIEVNDELGALQDWLEQMGRRIRYGGRLVVISYHSVEDRLVKRFMKWGHWEEAEKDIYGRPLREPLFEMLPPGRIGATKEEIQRNPRSRSARMRIARRLFPGKWQDKPKI